MSLVLCIGLFGCSKSASLESDFTDSSVLKVIQSIVNDYKNLGIDMVYAEKKVANSQEAAVFNNGKCNVTIYVNSNGELEYIRVHDNGVSDTSYSSDYIDTIDQTLRLDAVDFSFDMREDTVDFFNAGEETEINIRGYIINRDQLSFTVHNKTDEAYLASIPVKISDIEFLETRCYTNSIGTHWMEAKFKNNSDKTITHITLEYNVDGKKTYFTIIDTLNPGDVSTKDETFGPSSNNFDDAELLKADITIVDGDDTIYLDYDAKLDKYSW